MVTIYKYVLEPGTTEIKLPKGAEILSVSFQEDFCMWAAVDPSAEKETRCFKVFRTGHIIPQEIGVTYTFLGTGHMAIGLVFHAFEVINSNKATFSYS